MHANNEIILKNITKSFSGEVIIQNVNVTIKQGEIVIFTGVNGSGKSTILKIIAGLLHQDEGEANVFGISNKAKGIHKICEYVMESGHGYYGYLSAYENARYFFGLNKIKYRKIESEFHKLCDMFAFTPNLHKKIDELSQGNRQKLSLIIAILSEPCILLLDEPTNGLDFDSIQALADLLKQLSKERHITTLMTSHDEFFMKETNARILRVEEGTLINSERIESYTYKEEVHTMFNVWLSMREEERFKEAYPAIQMNISKDCFLVCVDEEKKNGILKVFDVVRLEKLNEKIQAEIG